MEPKKGDRVSLDAKKVGQPRRSGVVTEISKGLSGPKFYVKWEDGSQSLIAPGAGMLQIDGKAKTKAKTKTKAGKSKVKASAKKKKSR